MPQVAKSGGVLSPEYVLVSKIAKKVSRHGARSDFFKVVVGGGLRCNAGHDTSTFTAVDDCGKTVQPAHFILSNRGVLQVGRLYEEYRRAGHVKGLGIPPLENLKRELPEKWFSGLLYPTQDIIFATVRDAYIQPGAVFVSLGISGTPRLVGLPENRTKSKEQTPSSHAFGPCYEYVPPWHVVLSILAFIGAGFIIFAIPRKDLGDVLLAGALIFDGGLFLLVGHARYCSYYDQDGKQYFENTPFRHNSIIVPQKGLTPHSYWGTVIDMANVLNTDKQIAIIGALTEGSSIRSIERITGVHRDTIMRLGVRVGQGCAKVLDSSMRNLSCNRLELDEIWGFVGKKERNVREGEDGVGSVWTFCAIDAETKLVPAFKVGDRDMATAKAFVQDVADRMAYRVQISTDGLGAYVAAMQNAFGEFVDYGQIIKTYGHEEVSDNRRYSAPKFVSSEKKVVIGIPDERLISTSYVERLNATTRLHMRRLTRLTLAFSKKRENFEAAVALHFAYYNFAKRHNTLRCTPAMAAGVTNSFWTVGDLVEAAA